MLIRPLTASAFGNKPTGKPLAFSGQPPQLTQLPEMSAAANDDAPIEDGKGLTGAQEMLARRVGQAVEGVFDRLADMGVGIDGLADALRSPFFPKMFDDALDQADTSPSDKK